MDNNGIQMYPDKSRMFMAGQLYNCVDGDSDGLFRNSDNGETVLVGKYVVDDISGFQKIRKSIAGSFCQRQDINELSDAELYDLENEVLEVFHADDRLKSVIYPYTYEIQDCYDEKKIIYTISEVSDDFRSRYNKFRNVVFEKNFAINLRLVAVSNVLDIIQALNEKFNDFFQNIESDAIYIDTETGDVKIIIEKMLSCTEAEKNNRLNADIAYIIFEMLCMASPYDGKKTLVETPLLTAKTEDTIKNKVKKFVLADNDNGVSKYIGKEMLERWKALPEIMRNALEDNLDDSRDSLSYNISDWIISVRTIRDLLVLVNGNFKFCNPSENNRVLFFSIDPYLIPIWFKKAVYGYHVEEENYVSSKRVLLGVNKDGNIVNYADDGFMIIFRDRKKIISPGESFKPEMGMQIIINSKCISIISNND